MRSANSSATTGSNLPEPFQRTCAPPWSRFGNGTGRIVTSFGPQVAGLLVARIGGNFGKAAGVMTCFALHSILAVAIVTRLETRRYRYIVRDSAESTPRLSSCRFHERYCWPNLRQQKALENIMFSRALSGCGDRI
jgi:hypothetical protein